MSGAFVWTVTLLMLIGGGALSGLLGAPFVLRNVHGMSMDRLLYHHENARMRRKYMLGLYVLNLIAWGTCSYWRLPVGILNLFFVLFVFFFCAHRFYSKIIVLSIAEERLRQIEGQKRISICQESAPVTEPVKISDAETTDAAKANFTATFNEVWYLPRMWTLFDGIFFTYPDVGTLNVSGTGAEFVGKNNHVKISDVRRISCGRYGKDFFTKWVKIEYQDKMAFFADGRNSGWSGVLGGTGNILEAVQHLKR